MQKHDELVAKREARKEARKQKLLKRECEKAERREATKKEEGFLEKKSRFQTSMAARKKKGVKYYEIVKHGDKSTGTQYYSVVEKLNDYTINEVYTTDFDDPDDKARAETIFVCYSVLKNNDALCNIGIKARWKNYNLRDNIKNRILLHYEMGFLFLVGAGLKLQNSKKWKDFERVRMFVRAPKNGEEGITIWALRPDFEKIDKIDRNNLTKL